MPNDEDLRTALQYEANRARVQADAILDRIRRSGVRPGRPGLRSRWRRTRWPEVAAAGLFLAGMVALAMTRGPAPVPATEGRGPLQTQTPAGESGPATDGGDLNPQVAPPGYPVVVPPDLPAVTPPDGFISQQAALEKGVAAAIQSRGVRGGQLTLVEMRVAGEKWVLEFRGDGRAITFGEGPRPRSPAEDVSRVHLLGEYSVELDGRTGEVYGIRQTGMRLDPARADLEHYRGRIVTGGAGVTLRLIHADGTRAGRDLTVWVPQQAIDISGLTYWQLVYGTGRTLDVWGLTSGAGGQVVAYRLAMPDPPRDEGLTALPLHHGIPVYPEARMIQVKRRSGTGIDTWFEVDRVNWQKVRDWYLEQMPRYGWQPLRGPAPPADAGARFRFGSAAWRWAEITIAPREQGAHFTMTWGDEDSPQPE